MKLSIVRSELFLLIAFFIPAANCFAQSHPDPQRYEYLFMDGQFVLPHTSFPQGRERSSWKCFDGSTKKVFDCTFVRGGFDGFQYIYRLRR
jgi:hypothetical protein